MSELFPELEHHEASDAPVSGRRDDTLVEDALHTEFQARLSSRGRVAGDEALARFEAALGLPGMVRTLMRTDADDIEFLVNLPDGSTAVAALVQPGRPAIRSGRSFGVAIRGQGLPALLVKALFRMLARYDGVPLERLLDTVVPDPGDEHMLSCDDPESLFYAFAPSSGWRRFFEGTELYRNVCGAHRGSVAIIEHTDIECLYNVAPQDNRLTSFFAAPQHAAALQSKDPRWQAEDADARRMFTDIGDRDVIMGADRLLDDALLSLADDPKRPETVVVHSGCLPEVTGDDLGASVARTEQRLRLPVVVIGKDNDPLAAALSELVGAREFSPTRTLDPRAVALLGLPEFGGYAQLVELLEAAGISIAAQALPSFGPEQLEGCLRAAALVTYPWDRHAQLARRLSERLAPAKMLEPGAPFGLEGSCRWLRAIAAATGRSAQMHELLGSRLAQLQARWRELAGRARRYRVGFVVDQPDWQAALSPRRTLGVPMPAMLREMGFGLDVLVYARPGARLPGARRPRAGSSAPAPRVRAYRNREELAALLAEPGVVAWYSELRHDRRLTRSGKNPFSLRHFRMGLEGALESLRALVELAELPFYRRYSDYLGEPFAGGKGQP